MIEDKIEVFILYKQNKNIFYSIKSLFELKINKCFIRYLFRTDVNSVELITFKRNHKNVWENYWKAIIIHPKTSKLRFSVLWVALASKLTENMKHEDRGQEIFGLKMWIVCKTWFKVERKRWIFFSFRLYCKSGLKVSTQMVKNVCEMHEKINFWQIMYEAW